MKLCKSCNKILPLDMFTKSKNTKDGYENKCKKCRLEQRKKYINICETCGKEFKTAYKKSKYCSPECKPQSQRKRYIVKCSICGKEKEVVKSRLENYKDFYCSDECKNKGYSLKYSGANSHRYNGGKHVKCEICGKEIHRNCHEIDSYKHHYCSDECKKEGYKILFSGENNPNYNPNISDEERNQHRSCIGYDEWRRKVFSRDNYTCQCCGDNKGHNLRAHHKKNYSENKELRTDINNGITLCDICHKLFHDTYGYRNNNEKQLQDFLYKHENTVPSL